MSGGGFVPGATKASPITEDSYQLDFTPQELCAQRAGDPKTHTVSAGSLPETLEPGLWCISGSLGLHGNKGKLFANGSTLVFLDGGVSCNGNCDFQVSAPAAYPDPYPAVPGLAIYSLAASGWKLNGNNTPYFLGTILLPNANMELLGTGDEESFKTQIIVWDFEDGGNNASTFKWYDTLMYSKPATVELIR